MKYNLDNIELNPRFIEAGYMLPENPSRGDLYYDTMKGEMFQWDDIWFELVAEEESLKVFTSNGGFLNNANDEFFFEDIISRGQNEY